MTTSTSRRSAGTRKSSHPLSAQPLHVQYRLIEEILANPQNPRLHSAKQVDQLARSIQTFGFIVPVVVDENDQLVSGHGRCVAAKQLGMAEVPVLRISHLTESQKRAFLISDNKLTLNAEWDSTLLGEQFALLAEVDLDFDITVTGFEMAEIDLVIQGLDVPQSGPDPDDAPMVIEPGVSQLGDLWESRVSLRHGYPR